MFEDPGFMFFLGTMVGLVSGGILGYALAVNNMVYGWPGRRARSPGDRATRVEISPF